MPHLTLVNETIGGPMKIPRIGTQWLLAACLIFSFGCSTPSGLRGPASAEARWAVSGYLPEAPTQKVYVVINGRKIEEVSAKPSLSGLDVVIETNSLIFPGLMDLHS